MLLNVNATRMELLRLKKRLDLARRGLEVIDRVKELRFSIEKEFQSILERFVLAKAAIGTYQVEQELLLPVKKISVAISKRNIIGVHVPVYAKEVSGDIIPYGYMNTSGEMDIALNDFDKFIEHLLNLAEKEKAVQLMAAEIEETRRRVNVLEYKLIPGIIETIRFITMKLEEAERSSTVRLMKVKDIVRSH